ncbi:MAG: helix-turn-helix domain-containing protein [Candidatus Heimdallarchaeota archaeon]
MQPKQKLAKSTITKSLAASPKKDLPWTSPIDQRVYQRLKKDGPLTRDDLVERIGIPRTTVYDALTRLSIRGLITRFTQPRQSRGRRRVFFEVVG